MADEDVGMCLACVAVLRDRGMAKQEAIPYYEKLLEHHHLVPDDVNKNALRLTLERKLPSMAEAIDHLNALFPDLKVVC